MPMIVSTGTRQNHRQACVLGAACLGAILTTGLAPAASVAAGPSVSPTELRPTRATGANTLVHRVAKKRSVKIVAKVGDLVITNHQVDARSALMMQGSRDVATYFKSNIQKRWKSLAQSESFRKKMMTYVRGKQPTSKEEAQKYAKQYAMRQQKALATRVRGEAVSRAKKSVGKKALDALIDERLKLYEAKRLNVLVSDEEVKTVFASIAKRNKKTVAEFEAQLRKGGVSPHTLREKIRADRSWGQVIRKQFGFQLHMMQSNLDRYLGQSSTGSPGDAMIDSKKIVLGSSGGAADLAANIQQAENLRTRISGCASLQQAAGSVPGARVENVGNKRANEIQEPVRTLLMNAKPGELIPPQIGNSGAVELWVLCSRKSAEPAAGAGANAQSTSAIDKQRQREFQILARRHLNDLRREVHIEYR